MQSTKLDGGKLDIHANEQTSGRATFPAVR